MKENQNLILPIDMSALSMKTKNGSDPLVRVSASVRRKVVGPLYTMDMTRAKTVNNVEEQRLIKTLKDLDKQQNKMQSELLSRRASLLPEIKVTSAWEDKSGGMANPDGNGELGASTGEEASSSDGALVVVPRKRSGSLPPLAFLSVAERARHRASSESACDGKQIALAPPAAVPSTAGEARRARTLDEHRRPKSASPAATTTTTDATGRRRVVMRSRSLNSSTESLPSDLPAKNTLSVLGRDPAGGSSEEMRPRDATLLPLRKAKSNSNLCRDDRNRRVTVDTADLARLHRNCIFRNPSYNPVLLNPCQPRGAAGNGAGARHRRSVSPVRLSHLSADGAAPSPPDKPCPSLQDQFEELKKCRYLRVPSDDSD